MKIIKMKSYIMLLGVIAMFVKNSGIQAQSIDLYGMVESIQYNPTTLEVAAYLYVAYNNNNELPASIIVGCYISKDTIKDSQDIKYSEFNLAPSSFVDSYKRWGPATVKMSGEAGNWYILMVIDEKNSIAETNEKNNTVHSKMFTVAGGGTGISNAANVLSSVQIYPNPFHNKTNISFFLTQKTKVSIVLYDALGKQLAVIVNKELEQGEYKYDFISRDLAYGIYSYIITTGDKSEKRKIMIY